jgi:uncharacterized protein YegP (UPF0339 family)
MFEIKNGDGGGYYWTLQGDNNETLCHSEIYTSKAAAKDGIAAVRKVAPDARLEDRT